MIPAQRREILAIVATFVFIVGAIATFVLVAWMFA